MAIFPNVCLWRRRYAQNWEVLTLKNCYSIEPPSYPSAAYVVASYDPRFFSTVRFVKIRATCENFLGKWFTAPPWQKISRTPMPIPAFNFKGGPFHKPYWLPWVPSVPYLIFLAKFCVYI